MTRFLSSLVALVAVHTILFQVIMFYEGQSHSWLTGIYWTLVTMSTLGFGDIVFVTDLGRGFSITVLLSGIIFMLVLLPSTFIQLVYEPWVKARESARIPRSVTPETQGHVILTFFGPVAASFIGKLTQFNYAYIVILPEPDEVAALRDQGVNVMCGDLDDPETYRRARVEQAAMVATTRTDIENTTVVFTARGLAPDIPIIATARESGSEDILRLAGCTRTLNLSELMARALARRAIGGTELTHVVGRMDDLVIAEVAAERTTLVGETLGRAQQKTAISIVGAWTRGHFDTGNDDFVIDEHMSLVMAGSPAQLREFDTGFRGSVAVDQPRPVIIIGGGRVGRATGAALQRRGISYRIVEQLEDRIRDPQTYVLGSASDNTTLRKAGIEDASTLIITTRDDEMNIYLTIFCRLLRPDIQIISRATLERNVSALHRAGSDMVMSYATMGANALFNLLKRSDLLMVAEGLNVFKLAMPQSLAGRTLVETDIRHKTGCTVIGIDTGHSTTTYPDPTIALPAESEIVLIGTADGESRFLREFGVRVNRTRLPPGSAFCQTETCDLLSPVNGDLSQSAHRSTSVSPASRAIRSNSDGYA